MTKKCPRCNSTFECQHSSNCWCSKYTIPDNVKVYLKANYNDCLCENCLNAIIKEYKQS